MMAGLLAQGTTSDSPPLRRKAMPSPRDGEALVIGLVNNMPDAELENTERQFRTLLDAASAGIPLRIRLLALAGVPRSDTGHPEIAQRYVDVAALADDDIDGLIVTGTEPRAAALIEEPFWPAFGKLVDWAAEHTVSTVWSCLAAHAAVLYLDGIPRHRFPAKLSGVFECETSLDHPLVHGQLVPRFVPHSRHNGLAEDLLASRGYQILSRSAEAGPDMFVRQDRSLFVFLQGHPEYDQHALHREYRRDVGRFLSGRSDHYPEVPRGYFDTAATDSLMEFRVLAMRNRSRKLMAEFPVIADTAISQSWSKTAVAVYREWLEYLYAERSRSGSRRFHSRSGSRLPVTEIAGMA